MSFTWSPVPAITSSTRSTKSHGRRVLRVATGICSGGAGDVMLCHPRRIPGGALDGIYMVDQAWLMKDGILQNNRKIVSK